MQVAPAARGLRERASGAATSADPFVPQSPGLRASKRTLHVVPRSVVPVTSTTHGRRRFPWFPGTPAAEPEADYTPPARWVVVLRTESYLVDPASNICLSQRLSHAGLSAHGRYSETANGSLNQLWFL